MLFVATKANFADNLSMAGVTGQAGALALQISPSDLDGDLNRADIERMRPDRIVVVGDTATIPDAVPHRILVMGGTAAASDAVVADLGGTAFLDGAGIAYVANAWVFGGPLLLTSPTALPAETAADRSARPADRSRRRRLPDLDPQVHLQISMATE